MIWGLAREVKCLIPRVLKNCKETFCNGMLLLCHPISMCFSLSNYSYFVSRFSRSYFNTFGGNPVCTAAGSAVLKVIEKEKLQQNAFVVGSHLKERLTALKDKYEGKVSSLILSYLRLMHITCIHKFILKRVT
jgi:hypothetical protein